MSQYICDEIRKADAAQLMKMLDEIEKRRIELDICEHGVRCGEWCLDCNREYKEAVHQQERAEGCG